MSLDPITSAILSQALTAAAREMGIKLVRSAYSTVLREARDGSAALLDAAGNTVAQAELIPMQLGTIDQTFRACIAHYPVEEIKEGEFLMINDPYSGGQHLQDIFIFHPIFVEGRILGFAASVAHHLDISGGTAGVNLSAKDIYAEGLILPPLKLDMERDWTNGAFRRLIRANLRVPHITMGDFEAQMAANAIGIARVRELAVRYGADKVAAAMQSLQDYSETRMRAAINACADGTYSGEDWLDGGEDDKEPIVVRSTVTIEKGQVTVDFAGTSAQVDNTFNSPLASTIAAALSCVKITLTSPDIPFNAGAARPITIKAPEGSILNPRHPAPVRSRMEICLRAFNATMKALEQAAPGKAIATGFDTTTASVLSFLGEKGWAIHLDILGGGWGASAAKDGCDAVDCPLSNCSNTPVEALDQDYDYFRVVEYALRPDSGGAGERRGGLGFTRAYEALRDGVKFVFYSDRFVRLPQGAQGGAPGAGGFCRLERDGVVTELGSRVTTELKAGDRIVIGMGGGGGYGAPDKRPAALIQQDIDEGLVSVAVQ